MIKVFLLRSSMRYHRLFLPENGEWAEYNLIPEHFGELLQSYLPLGIDRHELSVLLLYFLVRYVDFGLQNGRHFIVGFLSILTGSDRVNCY